jgi:16S rRNA (uracil1498-N3)-methyltransferase
VITLLVTSEELGQAEIAVEGPAFRHLVKARRAVVGDAVRLVDGRGRARWGRLSALTDAAASLEVREAAPPNEPTGRLELVVTAPKGRRLAWMVEKATEVGVAAIRLLHSQRVARECRSGTLRRLRRVAAAAVEQSHRSLVPEISGIHPWDELPEMLARAGQAWFLEPRARAGKLAAVAGRLALVVGPEGGWTDSEREELEARGYLPLGLGPTILRTETAAVVGGALLLSHLERHSGGFH